MRSPEPPPMATWLMTRLLSSPARESLIGDLVERHRHRRARTWYWRQALLAIATDVLATMWAHRLRTTRTLIVVCLALYGFGLVEPRLQVAIDASWKTPLDDWILGRQMYTTFVWTRRIGLDALTPSLLWCSAFTASSALAVRLQPRQRSSIVLVLIVAWVASCEPFLVQSVRDWMDHPRASMWFWRAAWFWVWTLAAVPSCMWIGGGMWRVDRLRQQH
jgi:hypothetical protein